MFKESFLLLLATLIVAPLHLAEAQQVPGKVPRIAYVMGRSGPMEFDEAFRQGLRELGYVEGQNITIEYRWGEGREERLAALMAEVTRLKPDVIVTSGTPGVLAAKNATRAVPIVMANSPVRCEMDWLQAWRDRAATSQGSLSLPRS